MLCRASVLRMLQILIYESDRIPSSVLLRSRLAYRRAPAAPLPPCAMRIKFLKVPNLPTDACTGGPLSRTREHKVHAQGSASGVDFPSVQHAEEACPPASSSSRR